MIFGEGEKKSMRVWTLSTVPGQFTLALAKGFKMVKWGFLVQRGRGEKYGNLNRQKGAYGVCLWWQKKWWQMDDIWHVGKTNKGWMLQASARHFLLIKMDEKIMVDSRSIYVPDYVIKRENGVRDLCYVGDMQHWKYGKCELAKVCIGGINICGKKKWVTCGWHLASQEEMQSGEYWLPVQALPCGWKWMKSFWVDSDWMDVWFGKKNEEKRWSDHACTGY